ncbi:MAG: restriction endonuclease subunit S [Ignavibacteriaceae bacterium]|jgi:type I restriction enzyme S subunit
MKVKPGYKQTEIGLIPNDWVVKPIDKEIDLLTGFPFPSSKYSKVGIKLLRGSNVKRGVTDWSEEITQYWERITNEIKPYLLAQGDIVIAMDGSLVGKSFARLSYCDLPAVLLQRVARIRSNKLDMGYLKEFICSDYFTNHCESVKTVSAIPHISPSDIRSFSIPIPPTIKEQTAIAQALSDTDELISSLDKLISKKRNIKQGAMQQLLTGKTRLSPFNKKYVGYKQTEVGLIPEDWELVSFEKAFKSLRTATYSRAELTQNDETMYVHYGDIHTKYNYFLNFNKATLPSIPKSKVKNYSLLVEGDLIMVDASEDYTAINKSVEVKNIGAKKVISGLHTILLRDSENSFSNGFRGYIISSSVVKNQFDKLATGMKVYGVSKNNLKNVFIPTPSSKEEQTAIAQILSDMDSEIETLEKKRDKYKAIKQGMMQELLTGKTRLV